MYGVAENRAGRRALAGHGNVRSGSLMNSMELVGLLPGDWRPGVVEGSDAGREVPLLPGFEPGPPISLLYNMRQFAENVHAVRVHPSGT